MKAHFIFPLILLAGALANCGNQNKKQQSEKQLNNVKDSLKSPDVYDSTLTNKANYLNTVLEAPKPVYGFLFEQIGAKEASQICSNSKGSVSELIITVEDSTVVKANGKVLEFNKHGELDNYSKNADLLTKFFENESSTNFNFKGLDHDYMHLNFHIKMSKLCKRLKNKN